MEETNHSPGIGVKAIALLLMVGGGTGATFAFVAETHMLFKASIQYVALYGFVVFIFGWSAWTGYGLWKGEVKATRNAKLIFAAQIPMFVVRGLSLAGFSTGLRVYCMMRSQLPVFRYGLDVSPTLYIGRSQESGYWAVGINLLAVAVLAYLMGVNRPAAVKRDGIGLI